MSAVTFEPGSFRDPDGRVFTVDRQIYRALTDRGYEDWVAFRDSRTCRQALARGAIVETTEVASGDVPCPPGPWRAVLRHRTVPFVSYPYEWTFGMLRDAALLQLDLLLDGLSEGIILKDGTPFNVQWIGASPTFIDLSSFSGARPGEPWAGYRQFCCLCLNPLLLQTCAGVSFRPWLRGSPEGIEPSELAPLLSWRDRLRPGVFSHVYLHARLQRRFADTTVDVRASLKESGLGTSMIAPTVRSLRRTIERLPPPARTSPWVDYATGHTYDASSHAEKRAFVEAVLVSRRRPLVWDMGANTGEYSRLAAERSDYVLAFDADEAAIERLYAGLRRDGPSNILPLVVNAANPSPALGWRAAERKALLGRGRPDLVLCLALAHHLILGANIPIPELIDHIAELTDEVVIEFVERGDAMVTRLLRNREDVFADYTRAAFEAELARQFRIVRAQTLSGGTRTLYHACRTAAPGEARPL